jgi:benzoyl-CoA reductase subunit C
LQALERAKALSRDRGARARELAKEGRRVIGYMCIFPPVELITGAGLVPFRITGSPAPITEADAYLEPLMCPFVRSCFDLAVRGEFDFLSGTIWPHSCDNVQKPFDIWKHYVPSNFFHYLDVPHMTFPSSFEFFTEELNSLKAHLEEFSGRKITEESLLDAIHAHNENRELLRELSGLRKQDPPLLSGTEMMEVMRAVSCIPVAEGNPMLEEIIEEVKSRKKGPEKTGVRLLVWGSEIDNPEPIRLLEDTGARVVIDDICMGTKSYLSDVATEGNLLGNLANRYLGAITCPRTFRFSAGSRGQDLRNRFGHLVDLAREYRVNGAVLYVLMFCDTFEFDVPDVRDVLQRIGIPTLHVEDDYRLSGAGGMRTRIEAFMEMIGTRSDAAG